MLKFRISPNESNLWSEMDYTVTKGCPSRSFSVSEKKEMELDIICEVLMWKVLTQDRREDKIMVEKHAIMTLDNDINRDENICKYISESAVQKK